MSVNDSYSVHCQKRAQVLRLIYTERLGQIEKWHDAKQQVELPQSPDAWKCAVLGEEFGEVAKAVVENDKFSLRRELVHVAAVAHAWLEALE